MKKFIVLLYSLILISGCESGNTAKGVVEDYLSSYQNLEYQVLTDMEEIVSSEIDFTDEQKDLYRDILKKQYEDFEYEITNESYNEDEATVKAKISVYDYYKVSLQASDYLKNNVDEFYDKNNEYSNKLYMDYKLNLYKKTTTKVTYEIEFNLVKENGIWKLYEVSNDVLEKIHGIYEYE